MNIIKFFGGRMRSFEFFDLFLEYVDCGTLYANYRKRNEELLFFWVFQVCQGLSHMHGLNLIHRDIKPSNLFVTKEGIVKIGDFTLAREEEIEEECGAGTISYMPPELIKKR